MTRSSKHSFTSTLRINCWDSIEPPYSVVFSPRQCELLLNITHEKKRKMGVKLSGRLSIGNIIKGDFWKGHSLASTKPRRTKSTWMLKK